MPNKADEDLVTEHLANDLQGRSVRGGVAILAAQTAQFGLGLISTAILARLLTPSDFGLVAMVAAFSGFLSISLDFGLGAATVQRPDLTSSQLSALFWINTGTGLILATIMIGLAPLVAHFYGQPDLTWVTAALAFVFVFSGLSIQHSALLRRQMRFPVLAVIDICSMLTGVVAAVAAAMLGAGYWALVWMQLVQRAAAAAGTWWASGWKPMLPSRAPGMRPLLAFGSGLTAFNMLTYLARNVDNVIIGRAVGAEALGLYLKSYSLLLLPVERIRGPVSSVVVPALSRLQLQPERFKSYFLNAITAVSALGMPAVAFLFVFARDAILLILGSQWLESVIIFQVLAPAAFVETFNIVGSWACTALGNSARLVRWQIVASGAMITAFLLGVRWGTVGVAAAFTLSTVILRVPGVLYLLKDSPVRPVDLVRVLARPACTSIAAAAIVLPVRMWLSLEVSAPLLLVTGFAVFAAVYLALWYLSPGGRQVFRELRVVFTDLSRSRSGAARP